MQIGTNIKMIGGTFDGANGTIESFTNDYYFIRLADGSLIKSLPQEFEVVTESAPNTITLTREDFEIAVAKVVTPSLYKDEISDYGMITAVCLSGELVCKKLARELFGDSEGK